MRCSAKNKSGGRCKSHALKGRTQCLFHYAEFSGYKNARTFDKRRSKKSNRK